MAKTKATERMKNWICMTKSLVLDWMGRNWRPVSIVAPPIEDADETRCKRRESRIENWPWLLVINGAFLKPLWINIRVAGRRPEYFSISRPVIACNPNASKLSSRKCLPITICWETTESLGVLLINKTRVRHATVEPDQGFDGKA